ncbi:hypothetical protein sS8_0284 [Methylocaldum marinum]|uniref:Uncharacterized protein n=1 Tax=Methylocaldum marinum TaxID=1432792 RepID=A0A286P3N0_9GAMM|nr:hypothetical protein sS8_0284 [Methylocaldum marinum]
MIYDKFSQITDDRIVASLIGMPKAKFTALVKVFESAAQAIDRERVEKGEIKHVKQGGPNRLLKFAAMPSALPFIGGLIFSAEGPFSAEIPVLAGFHPPAWGFLPPFGEFWADARLGRRPPPAEQPTQPGQVVGGESEHGLGRHFLQTPEPGLA